MTKSTKCDDALALAVGDGQVVVPAGDARVDDRDANAGAVVAHQLLHRARADGHRGAADEAFDGPIEVDLLDAGIAGERLQLAVRNLGNACLEDRETASGFAAVALHDVDRVAVVVELDDDVRFVAQRVFDGVVQLQVELGVTTRDARRFSLLFRR